MAKIPKGQRRNPQSSHVQAHHAYREKNFKPKARTKTNYRDPLTLRQYHQLMWDYERRAQQHLDEKQRVADNQREKLEKAWDYDRAVASATVSSWDLGYSIVKEIISHFKHTKGLRVFGFGAGYGQVLFFLRNFAGARVQGADLGNYMREITRGKKLGIHYKTDAANSLLQKHGQFDVTYSINLIEWDVIQSKKKAMQILANASAMTRLGGKSYHLVTRDDLNLTEKDFESTGFRLDGKEKIGDSNFSHTLFKLTKIR